MQSELKLLKTAHQSLKSNYPNISEWININNIIHLLELMLDATDILSKSSYPTISNIRLVLKSILQHVQNFVANKLYSKEECIIAKSINDLLTKYWSIFDGNKSTKIATIFDPASKLITFLTSERERAITSLKNVIAQYASPELVTVKQQTTELQTIRKVTEQLETYLSSPIIANGSDLFQWWANNNNRFPILAKIAQNYLAIQGSSVPCEEAFSTTSRTISKLRNRLNPKTANASICLKSWIENDR
ncbi:12958_t:CDS:2 [Dentiscutata erythropus]|uniref:12958_t:CDS:1 n=1 Tax=Dentiscutata erythropus TaxID=1348616 RepID=A0A9N9A8M2_9GLOM|nr:12958_t:CDS:2 [Dentiscutata erythropus]